MSLPFFKQALSGVVVVSPLRRQPTLAIRRCLSQTARRPLAKRQRVIRRVNRVRPRVSVAKDPSNEDDQSSEEERGDDSEDSDDDDGGREVQMGGEVSEEGASESSKSSQSTRKIWFNDRDNQAERSIQWHRPRDGSRFKDEFVERVFQCQSESQLIKILNEERQRYSDSQGTLGDRHRFSSAIRKAMDLGCFDLCFDLFFECKETGTVDAALYSLMIRVCAMQATHNRLNIGSNKGEQRMRRQPGSLVTRHSSEELLNKSMDLFVECATLGIEPSASMYAALIRFCTQIRDYRTGLKLWNAAKQGLMPDLDEKRKSGIQDDLKELSVLADSVTQSIFPENSKLNKNKKKSAKQHSDDDDDLDLSDILKESCSEHGNESGGINNQKKLQMNNELWSAGLTLLVKSKDMSGALSTLNEYCQLKVSDHEDSVYMHTYHQSVGSKKSLDKSDALFVSLFSGISKGLLESDTRSNIHKQSGSNHQKWSALRPSEQTGVFLKTADELMLNYLSLSECTPNTRMLSSIATAYASYGCVYETMLIFRFMFEQYLMLCRLCSEYDTYYSNEVVPKLIEIHGCILSELRKIERNLTKKSKMKDEEQSGLVSSDHSLSSSNLIFEPNHEPKYWAKMMDYHDHSKVHSEWMNSVLRVKKGDSLRSINESMDVISLTPLLKSLVMHFRKTDSYQHIYRSEGGVKMMSDSMVNLDELKRDPNLYVSAKQAWRVIDHIFLPMLRVELQRCKHEESKGKDRLPKVDLHIVIGLLCRACQSSVFLGQNESLVNKCLDLWNEMTDEHKYYARPQSLEMKHLLEVLVSDPQINQEQHRQEELIRFFSGQMSKYGVPYSPVYTQILKRHRINTSLLNTHKYRQIEDPL